MNAELKALFDQHGLGSECAGVCEAWGVKSVGDLGEMTKEDVDDLPDDTLKKVAKRKLRKMIDSQQEESSSRSKNDAVLSCPERKRRKVDGADCSVANDRRRIYAFLAKQKEDHRINIYGEAQRVMDNLKGSLRRKSFELDCFPLATFDSFDDKMRDCSEYNVVLTYFGGHAEEGGKLCFSNDDSGSQMEMLGPDLVAPCIARASKGAPTSRDGSTNEGAVLNACHTRELGFDPCSTYLALSHRCAERGC